MKNQLIMALFCVVLFPTLSHADFGFGESAAGSLTSMPPQSPVLAYPPDGVTGATIAPELRWRTLTHAASYRVQVSTKVNFSTTIIDAANVADTTLTATGLQHQTVYYWRVSGQNVAGAGNYSDIYSFTTVIAPPAAPSLASPTNGAVNQPLTVELKWNSVTSAASYQVQVSKLGDFSTRVVDQSGITNAWLSVSHLEYGTNYFWRVRATNAGGNGEFSNAWSFATLVPVPAAPMLVSPANNATGVALDVELRWRAVATAASYQLQVSAQADFSTLVTDQPALTDTAFTATGLSWQQLYYWRVRARNTGGQSDYSTLWTFTTRKALPAVPTLVSPINGASGVPLTVELKWNSVSGATDYHVQVSPQTDFSVLIHDKTGLTNPWIAMSGLENQKPYYWRVRAHNDAGFSDFATPWSFTTVIAPPAAPILAAPANNAVNVVLNPELKWNGVSGATSYHVQVATDANFSSLLVDQSAVISTWYIVNSLSHDGTFYWRVRASNAGGEGAFSAVWQFSTLLTAVDAEDKTPLPTEFAVLPVYPNPFNSQATITFNVPTAANVTLNIFNTRGQLVRTLASGMFRAGSHTQHWDSRDDHGRDVTSGIYFVWLMTEGKTITRKLILVR